MIKAVSKNDIPECVSVIKSSFLTVARQFGFTAENAPRFIAFAVDNDKLYGQYDDNNRLMYVYLYNNIIVGYYSIFFMGNGECEINNMCVLPKYRNNGIGKELLQHAVFQAAEMKCTKINISIVEENIVLRKWYEKLGFLHTESKKFSFFPFTCGYMVKEI